MRIFIAGGTGVIGRPLVAHLVAAGHDVTASTHRTEVVEELKELGAHQATMDGRDVDSIREAITAAAPEVIINQMTSLSAPAASYGDWLAVTNALRNEGTRAIMEAARDAGTRRVVSQSAAFMFEPTDETADESSPLHLDAPDPVGIHIRSSAAGEDAVLGTSGVEGLVLRYGFFYGPGTAVGSGGEWSSAVQSGQLPIVGDGGGVYPFIHVDDAVSATLRAVDNGAPGVYNVVCDEPAPQREWISYLAELLDAPAPPELDADDAADQLGVQSVYYGTQLPRVSNAKAKAQLGMELRYAAWRDGFVELFGERE